MDFSTIFSILSYLYTSFLVLALNMLFVMAFILHFVIKLCFLSFDFCVFFNNLFSQRLSTVSNVKLILFYRKQITRKMIH